MSDPTAVFQTPQGDVDVGPYRPGDDKGILELFKTVFDVDRDPAAWNWQFRDGPVGVHAYVGRADDRIVSQFCSIPVKVKLFDHDVCFGQMVDSMVHPDYRGGLKKKGLFATTVDAYVEKYGHLHEEVIMMGLPNPEAYRIGKKLCGYQPMTKTYLHTRDVACDSTLPDFPEEVRYRMTDFRVRRVERFDASADELFERLKARWPVIAHRDALHLNWRYADNPNFDYDIIELRTAADDVLHGYAVCREDWLENYDFVVADWFCDHHVPGAAEALEATLHHHAAQKTKPRIHLLLNHMCPESRFFEDNGYFLTPTRWRMVSRTYAPDVVTPEFLNHHWYYTIGDFDVV